MGACPLGTFLVVRAANLGDDGILRKPNVRKCVGLQFVCA